MKPDAFEKRASAMRPRPVPAGWRDEILAAARAAAGDAEAADGKALTSETGQRRMERAAVWRLWAVLRGWLWPAPWAWGGLAGVWLLILVLHRVAAVDERPVAAVVPWSYLALQGPPAMTVNEARPAEPARRQALPGTGWRQRSPIVPGVGGSRSMAA
ncbi:MAG TPA: hypothetical protein PKM73_08585 [Verrucomicrobiota bacterium]|nr:hypothetical protein [Verrucomicrobiota bacterium]HNU51827.1 hypothetical protein [Verrucomicrobiota bacterium]